MPALRSEYVLCSEAQEILNYRNGDDKRPTAIGTEEQGTALYNKLNESTFTALCLSGGGIRSAAFSLGVIQALAAYPRAIASHEWVTISDSEIKQRAKTCLLSQFDYLSTVSGGGYIGSWLSAWCSREGFQTAWRNLISRPKGPDVEPRQISWLRSYSNYLTPRLGLMSSDVWIVLSTYICNLLLNWLMILPLFCCAILALKILVVLLDSIMIFDNPLQLEDVTLWGMQPFKFEEFCSINWQPYALFCALPATILLIVALSFQVRQMVLHRAEITDVNGARQSAFLRWALVPTILSAVMLATLIGSDPFGKLFENISHCDPVGLEKGAIVQLDETASAKEDSLKPKLACTRFRRHRVRCFNGTGGGSWRGGSSHASSSLRLCA
jgi:Patatin-like phospholipase